MFFITVRPYAVDVNGALYALLCCLVLIKSGLVRDVPWPRKASLPGWRWHRAIPQVAQRSGGKTELLLRDHGCYFNLNLKEEIEETGATTRKRKKEGEKEERKEEINGRGSNERTKAGKRQ